MKFTLIIVLILLLFNSAVYAKGPSIEATQKYITNVIQDKEKFNAPWIKLNFSGKCIGKFKDAEDTIIFDLINKHSVELRYDNSSNTEYMGILSRLGIKNVHRTRDGKHIESEQGYNTGIEAKTLFNGIYSQKIKKAIIHLNAECRKLHIKTSEKELF